MIKIIDVNKSFQKKEVLNDVNLVIERNNSIAIMGESGSGKTTLLRIISGLIRPDRGEIWIDNLIVDDKATYVSPFNRNLGFIFQEATLWPHMTVERNIEFGVTKASKANKYERIREVMNQTGICDLAKKYPSQISGGQAKRVAIARAIATRPNYLLLDEPLTNLDQKAKLSLLDLLLKIRDEEKCTYVYVSHQKDEIDYLESKVYLLEDKRVIDYA